VSRLRARRRERLQRWQFVVLVLLAVAVTLGAVFGAYALVKRLTHHAAPVDARTGLVLLTVGARDPSHKPIAALTLYDPVLGGWRLFALPRALLLESANGAYVMAGDAMGSAALPADLARLVRAKIAQEIDLSYASLIKLTGGGPFGVQLARPVMLRVDGAWRTFDGAFSVTGRELPAVLSADGKSGEDEDAIAQAVLSAALHAGALLTAQQRATAIGAAVGTTPDDRSTAAARQALKGLLSGRVAIERFPSAGVVSEGQFAFRPDPSRIMSEVTRRVPGYAARFTVLVRNGTGEVGIGSLVRQRLAVLDVNLPSPSNAEAFDYKQTQILAGSQALGVAENVRAILGRGVVLSGQNLPATTLVIIIGSDLKAKDLQ
jgi:LytR cell envelope-related transcriptional attenuator